MSKNTYCVRFTGVTQYKVTVKAATEYDAISEVQRRWERGDPSRFRAFAIAATDWDAFLIASWKGGAS